MRLLVVPLLIASVGLSGCVRSSGQSPPTKWTTGFWLWQGNSAEITSASEPLDALYIHVGAIQKPTGPYAKEAWFVYGGLPDHLPLAREYWLVFRFERQFVPDLLVAPILAREVSRLREDARQRHLNVVGVQLDIDSPTRALSEYANLLRAVKKDLPLGVEVSITALLDWFRSGTSIGDVIKEVDEFVPQFYDVSNPDSDNAAIATKFDAAQWGPVFNRFGKRFRIGISTFGRARMVPRENPVQSRYQRISLFQDVTPLDIAILPAFGLQTSRNEANELVLNYRATRKTRIGYNEFEAGDTVQFILSTPDTIRAAVESAKRMGGYSAGVIFFRWPASNETLVMQPNEVLIAAGITTRARQMPLGIHLVDGGCVAVKCMDIYLVNANPLSSKPVRYRIRSSQELEYFLPEEKIPVRMVNAAELELALPPYCGRGRMYLGRAVTATRAEFTVSETP